MLKQPEENAIRDLAILFPFASEETDRLRRGVDIDRVDSVVVILRRAIFQEEAFGVVLYALGICGPVLLRQPHVENVTDCLKIKARVTGIHPSLYGCIGIVP